MLILTLNYLINLTQIFNLKTRAFNITKSLCWLNALAWTLLQLPVLSGTVIQWLSSRCVPGQWLVVTQPGVFPGTTHYTHYTPCLLILDGEIGQSLSSVHDWSQSPNQWYNINNVSHPAARAESTRVIAGHVCWRVESFIIIVFLLHLVRNWMIKKQDTHLTKKITHWRILLNIANSMLYMN